MTSIHFLRKSCVERFWPQTWYDTEQFCHAPLTESLPVLGTSIHPHVTTYKHVPTSAKDLPTAVQLVDLFLRYPYAPCWMRYLWTSDVDHLGQRVYVGGVQRPNDPQLEIHRYLAVDERWGILSLR